MKLILLAGIVLLVVFLVREHFTHDPHSEER